LLQKYGIFKTLHHGYTYTGGSYSFNYFSEKEFRYIQIHFFYIGMGGLICGLAALLLGMIGAIIIYPESNIAPIIGFIYTGPIGFILGLIGGGLYWIIKVKNKQGSPGGDVINKPGHQ
jgi:hypothetical protein